MVSPIVTGGSHSNLGFNSFMGSVWVVLLAPTPYKNNAVIASRVAMPSFSVMFFSLTAPLATVDGEGGGDWGDVIPLFGKIAILQRADPLQIQGRRPRDPCDMPRRHLLYRVPCQLQGHHSARLRLLLEGCLSPFRRVWSVEGLEKGATGTAGESG